MMMAMKKSQTPQQIDENAPIDPFDDRIIGCGLARTTLLEQYQVEANDITTSLMRCNTSMQPLISPSQAKSASYYAANYVSKDPYELSSSLPFLYQAQLELQKYGSKAEDHGQKSRNLKVLMEKLLHKVNKIEVSSQEAACAMLGYDSFYFLMISVTALRGMPLSVIMNLKDSIKTVMSILKLQAMTQARILSR